MRRDARTVMVVDDEKSTRTLVARVLQDLGLDVCDAADGRQALALLERGVRPRLALIDLMMPQMSGMELLGRLREDPDPSVAGMAVVVMTAVYQNVDSIVRPHSVEGILVKPFRLGDLRTAVLRFCESKRRRAPAA